MHSAALPLPLSHTQKNTLNTPTDTAPGFGFNATTGTSYTCPIGTYGSGNTRATCRRCQSGLTTTAASRTSPADCREFFFFGRAHARASGVEREIPLLLPTHAHTHTHTHMPTLNTLPSKKKSPALDTTTARRSPSPARAAHGRVRRATPTRARGARPA